MVGRALSLAILITPQVASASPAPIESTTLRPSEPAPARTPTPNQQAPEASEAPQGRVDAPRRWMLGGRVAFGVPWGKYATEYRLNGRADRDIHTISTDAYGVVALGLDAGYRFTDSLLFGPYLLVGVPIPRDGQDENPLDGGCPPSADCFGWGLRGGVRVEYGFAPEAAVQPWLSLGAGYERIETDITVPLGDATLEFSGSHAGVELALLEGGADFTVGPQTTLGPYAGASLTMYLDCKREFLGQRPECEISKSAVHSWLVLGIRGQLGL